jgi:hypothetical protein
MKTLSSFILTVTLSVIFNFMAQCQYKALEIFDNKSALFAKVSNSDVIVNKAMIASYQRMYDKIEVFMWKDIWASGENDFSNKYLAYLRIRLNNSSDKLEDRLNVEISAMKTNIPDTTNLALLAYVDKSLPTSSTSTSTEKSSIKTTEKPSSMKWITQNTK